MTSFTSTLRILSGLTLGTLALVGAYALILLGVGLGLAPAAAEGSLIRGPEGELVGSRLVGQSFTEPGYLWPRPSAVDHAADAAGGSNLAASNPALRERVLADLARHAASDERPIPADLVTASGSGLDPDITLAGALYQAPRIAAARRVDRHEIEERLRSLAHTPNPWSPPLINVLETNLELDRTFGALPTRPAE
ncbi:potassium-transporting ATPase subunit C [Nannocystaceae bacterium ST9]